MQGDWECLGKFENDINTELMHDGLKEKLEGKKKCSHSSPGRALGAISSSSGSLLTNLQIGTFKLNTLM